MNKMVPRNVLYNAGLRDQNHQILHLSKHECHPFRLNPVPAQRVPISCARLVRCNPRLQIRCVYPESILGRIADECKKIPTDTILVPGPDVPLAG